MNKKQETLFIKMWIFFMFFPLRLQRITLCQEEKITLFFFS